MSSYLLIGLTYEDLFYGESVAEETHFIFRQDEFLQVSEGEKVLNRPGVRERESVCVRKGRVCCLCESLFVEGEAVHVSPQAAHLKWERGTAGLRMTLSFAEMRGGGRYRQDRVSHLVHVG